MRNGVVRLIMAVVLVCAAVPGFAQLSPEAQQAIASGKEAAQSKNYYLAISYFQMARAAAPNAPEIYGYLGLTESKISGRELRAIAWYGAYLAANPRAGNAAAVNNAIAELMKTSENNISLLMKTWETAVANMPDSADRAPHTAGWRRDFCWSNVGEWYASYGSIEDARRIANAINAVPDPYMAGMVFDAIIDTQLKAGDRAGAKLTLKSIRDGGVLFPGVPSSKDVAKDKFDHAEQLRKEAEVMPGAAVSDWTQLFVAGAPPGLDGEMFTDLTASMHTKSTEPWDMVEQLSYVANNLGSMQQKIKRMLKVQAAQQVTQ